MEDYKISRRIAEGRFGTVFEASRISTGQRVAIKQIRARRPMPGFSSDPWSKSAEREIEVLGSLTHEHVVVLLDHFCTASATALLIYEYLAWDLATVLKKRKPMGEEQIKAVLLMLFRGMAHLHLRSVMHRDLKPDNLLLDGSSGVLKIADFGSARHVPHSSPSADSLAAVEAMGAEADGLALTRDVCTRWYKSPEMLFGAVDYTVAVDLWATGCIVSELLSPEGKPLFPGNSDLEQLCLIFQLRGTPQEDQWPEVCRLPDYSKVEFKARDPQPFDFQGRRSPEAVVLAQQLLELAPTRRLSADAALCGGFLGANEPAAAEPGSLVQGLCTAPDSSDLCSRGSSPLHEFDGYGSDDSCLRCLGSDCEPVEIETTSCGLWNDVPLSSADCEGREGCAEGSPAGSGARTPPPPEGGVHRFKGRV